MPHITSNKAERIADEILSTNDDILGVLILDDSRGDVLSSKSREPFRRAFGIFEGGARYGGSLALAALSVANELREMAGNTLTLITIYEKYKMMLLPLPRYGIVIGLALQSSINAEDYIISTKIQRLLLPSAEEGDIA